MEHDPEPLTPEELAGFQADAELLLRSAQRVHAVVQSPEALERARRETDESIEFQRLLERMYSAVFNLSNVGYPTRAKADFSTQDYEISVGNLGIRVKREFLEPDEQGNLRVISAHERKP
jgi:hypothetical protein